MTKVLSYVRLELHNARIESLNVRRNKGTTKCDKRTVICNVGTIQYEDETIKCDVLVTWYRRLPTSGYRTLKKRGGIVELPYKRIYELKKSVRYLFTM